MTINWSKEVLLITGASSGLGQAVAVEAAKLGASAILVARDKERLGAVKNDVEAAGGTGFSFAYDLHDTEGIPALYEAIKQESGLVPTMLVNNAGYNAGGFVPNTPVDVFKKNFDVNLFAPIAFIQAVLPDMLENRWGVIVDVIGAANYHSFPGNAAYCSSKVAIQAMHESLQTEMAGLPVKTVMFNPGSMATRYNDNRLLDGRVGDYEYKSSGGKSPVDSAKALLKGIEQGKPVVDCATGMDKIGRHLAYFVPWLVDKLLVDRNQALLKNRPFQ
ncbi:SDR family NAD(P)-dependent oxidoreductase [Pseudodesulfovibrio sp.]|nr:SDR family NAD(P)-dependent oxidoreductase [Pseudodesulfovibrio sp.]